MKLMKCTTYSRVSYGTKSLEYSSEIPCKCWERMEKISWTNWVKNEEILLGFKEERNMVHTIK
jgi:Fe-S cluster biosynthesis and repair protein YggX